MQSFIHKCLLCAIALMPLCAGSVTAAPYAAGVRYRLPAGDLDPRGAYRARLRVVDDLNGDGRRDLVYATPDAVVQALISTTPRAFGPRDVGTATTAAFASGDFNRDGKIDIVAGNATSFTVFAGNGDGTFAAATTVNLNVLGPNAGVEDIAAGDFDHDGKLDVAVIDADPLNNFRTWTNAGGNPVFYRNSVAVAYGLGNGQFDTTSRPRIGTTAYPQRLSAVDFENDGRPELIVVGAESKSIQIAYNNATHPLGSQSGTVFLHAPSEHADIVDVGAARLDGDTKPDLAVLFYTHMPDPQGHRYLLRPYRNTATGAQPFAYGSTLPAVGFTAAPGALALADVTGDTRADAIVTSRAGDRPAVTLYPGDGNAGFGAPDPLPERYVAEDLVAADLDNDGKIDLAVIDRSGYAVVVYWHL